MFTLKKISATGIERALEKVERYRLLNEPGDAESICLDVLEVEPDNQRALVALLLARTDQFQHGRGTVAAPREVLPRLTSEYQRAYYAGIICERWARARHARGAPGARVRRSGRGTLLSEGASPGACHLTRACRCRCGRGNGTFSASVMRC